MVPDTLHLRPATPADIVLLVELIRTAYAAYAGRLDPPSGAHLETVDTVGRKMEEGHFVIAALEDIVCGCVFYEFKDDYVYLGRLAVLPEFRQQGIGRTLNAHVEDAARSRGASRIELGARLQIPQNIRFYENQGYHILEHRRHPGYNHDTYVQMEKILD